MATCCIGLHSGIFVLISYDSLSLTLQGLCAQTFYGHMHSVNDVTFNLKVMGCNVIKLLCLQKYLKSKKNMNRFRNQVRLSFFQGDTLASCDSFGVVCLWDIRTVSQMTSIDCGPHPANKVTFDPSGNSIHQTTLCTSDLLSYEEEHSWWDSFIYAQVLCSLWAAMMLPSKCMKLPMDRSVSITFLASNLHMHCCTYVTMQMHNYIASRMTLSLFQRCLLWFCFC